jgi:hypothetical protein
MSKVELTRDMTLPSIAVRNSDKAMFLAGAASMGHAMKVRIEEMLLGDEISAESTLVLIRHQKELLEQLKGLARKAGIIS